MLKRDGDYLIKAVAAGGQVRACAISSRNLVEEIRKIHGSSPIATAALGRTLSMALMMGADLKGKNETLTIQISGDGPLEKIVVTANSRGEARGYVNNPYVIMEPNAAKHLNVGGAIGKGKLTVIRDMGMKEPHITTINLHSGEIADDFTYYFAISEQTPSSVGLGVLLNKNNYVRAAGGFIVQLMPNCEEPYIITLEENLAAFSNVTDVLKKKEATPEDLLRIILDGLDIEFGERQKVNLYCTCGDERNIRVLSSLPKDQLKEIIDEGKDIEIECEFCKKKYKYPIKKIEKIYKSK